MESMDAVLEERSPIEEQSAVISGLSAELALRVPQKETVLQ